MSIVLNSLSILCSFATIAGIAYLYAHKRDQADRVSFRITFVIAWVDILFALFSILAYTQGKNGNFCVFLAWGTLWTDLSFIFLNVIIAFNLQIVFLHGCKNIRHFERYFISGSFLAATLIATAPTIAKKLGFDPVHPQNCWFIEMNSQSTLLWEWLSQHIWIVLTTSYLLIISLCTIIKLARQSRRILGPVDIYDSQTQNAKHLINLAVRRIVLYPMVPILTHGLKIAYMTTQYTGREFPYFMRIVGLGLLSSQGVFNSIVFLFDPALQSTWRRKKIQRKSVFVFNEHRDSTVMYGDKKSTLEIAHIPHSHSHSRSHSYSHSHSSPLSADCIKQL
ncbi:hypothetical protein K493DRAFT_308537 [Basidiobolus meristosporus CBS 931.73]|uniref:Family A G protein-coupled receptor-like protein n=1 Tax=Basidiobolus meristosporus CBS 931.73 TaxID=1314790 RepID=A0A1Y1X159_9FUNG|nr:hypothetical protein K493DRAFT_308537 [Basidiobolus meristosporus CBS 931.73]|eukprot:ORX79432.1 hypothetical protein K493DRAFT_308537 [Basidiobolus meristosporus CBS 931.73]